MEIVTAFILGAVFSFLGSIPPGTLNMLVLQMGLEGRTRAALKFSLAVAIIEYPYAWIAVEFEAWVTRNPVILEHFQLITAVVMTCAGLLVLRSTYKASPEEVSADNSGFRRGIVLSILNPMAIPFWMAITAFLRSSGWLDISSAVRLHSYVLGTSVGTIVLLLIFIFLARRVAGYATGNTWVKKVPGAVLVVLGIYAFIKYLF